MARRNDHTHEELKAMSIASAQALIDAGGLSACSARKVAKAIGYAPGTLYNIFKNYDDLLLHVNGETLDQLYEFMMQREGAMLKGRDALKRFAALYILFVEQNSRRWSVLFEHQLPEGEQLPDWYQEKIAALFVVIEGVLMDTLSLEKAAAVRSARVLWSGLHGICSLRLMNKLDSIGADPMHVLVEDFIDHYMAGLGDE